MHLLPLLLPIFPLLWSVPLSNIEYVPETAGNPVISIYIMLFTGKCFTEDKRNNKNLIKKKKSRKVRD